MNTFQKKRTDGDNGPSFLLQGGNQEEKKAPQSFMSKLKTQYSVSQSESSKANTQMKNYLGYLADGKDKPADDSLGEI